MNKYEIALKCINDWSMPKIQDAALESAILKNLAESGEILKELLQIASTPICEDCEPKDLETAKIKLRLMADECNRQIGTYLNEIAKLEKALDKACYNYILEKLNYKVSKKTCYKLVQEEKQKLLKESEKENDR